MKITRILIITVLISITLTGCSLLGTASLVGHLAGGEAEAKSISYDYETGMQSRSQILSFSREIGAEKGWKITSETPEMLLWEVSESSWSQEYFGKHSMTTFYISVLPRTDDVTTIRMGASIGGNYDAASTDNINLVIQEFAGELKEKLEVSDHYLTIKE